MPAHELTTPPAAPRPQRSAGRHLTLLGVTPDGRRLRLADPDDPTGAEFTVEIDARLRAALGLEPTRRATRPGTQEDARVESQMETIRPRDIQARIRAGETPESVAAAAGTTVEKVMPYAAPVLAEREHVAQRAQRSSIRRPAGDHPAGQHAPRTLGEAVAGRLRAMNIDPETTVAWDAWRREDGRWSLTGRYSVPGREGLAELTFDQPGNFVIVDNDDARWLVGDLPDPPAAEPEAPVARRLAAVPADQPTLGDDVLGLVAEPDRPGESTLDLTETAASVRAGLQTDQPLEAFLDEPGTEDPDRRVETADAESTADDTATDDLLVQAEPPPRRPVKKNRGRASVPSWDEIMFGPSD